MSPHHSAHAAHRRTAASHPGDARTPDEPWGLLLDGDSAEVRERLEALDDAMFAAIAGQSGAIDRARTLWAEAAHALPWQLLEESREQYLRFAADATCRLDPHEVRDPLAAIAALEVIALLARE